MVRLIAALGFCLLALGASPEAYAAKRVAFVVGIDAYDNLPDQQQLKKAVNDAQAIGVSSTAWSPATRWRSSSRVGVEIDGQNFLLPRDVPRIESGECAPNPMSAASASSSPEPTSKPTNLISPSRNWRS